MILRECFILVVLYSKLQKVCVIEEYGIIGCLCGLLCVAVGGVLVMEKN